MAQPAAQPYAPQGDVGTVPDVGPVLPATTPDSGDSGLNTGASNEEPWADTAPGVDTHQHVAAWDAGRVEGAEGPIEASGSAEWKANAGVQVEDVVEFGTTVSDTVEAVADDAAAEEDVAEEQLPEAAIRDENDESEEPGVGDGDHSLARECRTQPELAAASEDDDDWFRDLDDETGASPRDTPTAALEPALFHGLGDLERLGPTPQPDPAPAPADAGAEGADGGLTMWPEPDSRATVAEALERVALRIRDGDVALPSDVPSASEEAALAAVLAALLHSRSR